MRTASARSTRRRLLAALALVIGATGFAAVSPSAQATEFRPGPVGSDDFRQGQRYSGDFPDPSVVRVGRKYFAYSTTIANQNLPVITSTDLKTWTARPVHADGTHQDGLPIVASWANRKTIGSRKVAPTWAPSVAYLGKRWVAAYATQLKNKSRFCISLAYAEKPAGPFVDKSTASIVCPRKEGAIDPFLWTSSTGGQYLLWKTEGVRSEGIPSRLWSRRLNAAATGFYPGSTKAELLRTAPDTWEGNVIENPAVMQLDGRLYLFYSGNNWSSDRYAVGYAVCKTIAGPCTRASDKPLLATTRSLAGPGGNSPFLDRNGTLRLAYHSWRAGQVGYPKNDACMDMRSGCPQRRLYVAKVGRDKKTGALTIARYVS